MKRKKMKRKKMRENKKGKISFEKKKKNHGK